MKKWLLVIGVVITSLAGVKFTKELRNPPPDAVIVPIPENEKIDTLSTYPTTLWASTLDLSTLTAHGVPVLINFTADWCEPCKIFNPILEETQKQLQGKVIIQIIDADKYYQTITKHYPVKTIPFQLLYDASGNPFEPPTDFPISKITEYRSEKTSSNLTTHSGEMTETELHELLRAMGVSF